MFSKKKINDNEKPKMDYELEIKGLHNVVDELKAQIYKLQYPVGEISYEYEYSMFGDCGRIKYIYSNNSEVCRLTLVSPNTWVLIDSFKIYIDKNTAYIGIKYIEKIKDMQISSELYFAVDLSKNNVVKINNTITKEFDRDWISWNK